MQSRIVTCETFNAEVINFFSVNILKISKNHWKIRKKFLQAIFTYIDFTKLSFKISPFAILSNFVRQFWNLEYKGKKVIIFVFLTVAGFFMVKLSFEIWNCSVRQQNCWAKCKLPWKSPGQTALFFKYLFLGMEQLA